MGLTALVLSLLESILSNSPVSKAMFTSSKHPINHNPLPQIFSFDCDENIVFSLMKHVRELQAWSWISTVYLSF